MKRHSSYLHGKIMRDFFADKCVRWTKEEHGKLFIGRLARLSHDVSDLPCKTRPWRIVTIAASASFDFY